MKNLVFLMICIICLYSCKSRQANSTNINHHEFVEVPCIAEKDILDQGKIVIDNYSISYILAYNEIIAHIIPDDIQIKPGSSREIRNKSLFLTVNYDGKIIVNSKEIRSTSFDEIENAEKFSLGPQNTVHDSWFSVVEDKLIVEFGASVEDTDWGYRIKLFINKNGQILSTVTSYDDLPQEM